MEKVGIGTANYSDSNPSLKAARREKSSLLVLAYWFSNNEEDLPFVYEIDIDVYTAMNIDRLSASGLFS